MRLWSENRRFAVVPSGRRSGKTELAKRRLVVSLAARKPWPDPRYLAGAPTREQAKRIYWKDLLAMIPRDWVRDISETDLSVTTRFGSELWVAGLDRPQRIEGVPWDGAVLDEYADMRATAWTENIRPALSDRRGWCWFIGVPGGLNHFKEIADYARSGVDRDWGFYSWPSSGILPPDEIEAARRVMDERTFRQEYEAGFEGASGRVYYAYGAEEHEDETLTVVPGLPIALCCDFNVGTCVWEAAQTDGKSVWVIDEIVRRDTNTVEMGKEALARYGGHRAGLVVYGDAAGMSRSTAGKSDYALLSELGLDAARIRRSNPLVKDRVNALNAMLRNTAGEVRLRHHPRCVYLRKDLECVEWTGGGGHLDKSNASLTHATDALGYFIEYEFPLRLRARGAERRFYK
jgi:hypothetical protein